MKKLVYLCPVCNRRFEVHCRGKIYEIKTLGCTKCKAIMHHTIVENTNANNKAKRVKGR